MYVYILRCADGSYYTGSTNELERRLHEHQQGIDHDSYTFLRRPIELVFHQGFKDATEALIFEKQVKGWNRKKKEALISGDWDKLPRLSKNWNKEQSSTSSDE